MSIQVIGPDGPEVRIEDETSRPSIVVSAPGGGGIVSPNVRRIVSLSQAAYDSLAPPDPDTLYLIV
jgi:hypothetical protein